MGHGHGHGHAHRGDAPTAAAASGTGDLARGAGRGYVLHLDAFSGIAGDMLLAALIDLGVPAAVVREAIEGLDLDGYRIELSTRTRSGIVAKHFEVVVEGEHPERTFREIRGMLEAASSLTDGARTIALRAFLRLAEAESAVHGMAVDEVHFHEVGAVDSIVDLVGAAVALDYLDARVSCSPLPMGHGTVQARHGTLPVPSPATVLCLRGVPTYDGGAEAELVTPTGACLVSAATESFARWPALVPERVGWGAGTRELPDRPNLLRVVLGLPAPADDENETPFVVLETNVDDTSPEIAAYAVESALASGALDAWTTAIGMKKGRPGILISALARRVEGQRIAGVLLTETSTLGVRVRPAHRIERPRTIVEVDTPYGPIAVKVAEGDGLPRNVAPEFEACRAAAASHDVPLKEVYEAALRAARGER